MQLLKPHWIAQDGQPIFSLDIHPDGTRFATGGQGADSNAGRVTIWNMAPVLSQEDADRDEADVPKLLSQMDRHLGCVNCLRWSPSGHMLASGGDDKLVMIWRKSSGSGGAIFGGGGKVNVEHWRCVHTLRCHNGDILDLAWSLGDKLLATASVDNTVIIWNGEKLPEMVATLRGHTGLVKGVVFDPVGKFLASQSDDKSLRVWRTSDWKEEMVVKDPFIECGATTHCLRPGWSPDGSMLVSAHAMNEGGPTAQIISRDTWKTEKDFVGHKKAITCVRFHNSIFEKRRKDGNKEAFVAVALGSRDRSFSVWATNLKRPFFVVTDVFDQSVLDLSWSKDGRVMMACSMDGTVAAVIFKEDELGRPMPEDKVREIMRSNYGKCYGLPVVKSHAVGAPSTPTDTAMVVENPELLLKKPSANANVASSSAKSLPPRPKGPTDKQIEARTSDGKRRITPIFIPPDEAEKTADFGSGEFKSLSTQEKSQIEIEKRDGVVKPNVSPSKSQSQSSSSNGTTSSQKSNSNSQQPNNEEKDADEPVVNIIQVRRKPRRIVDSSDEEEENPVEKKKGNDGKTSKNRTMEAKLRELAMAKPDLMTAKRKATESSGCGSGSGEGGDSPRPKKRGRPPVNRTTSSTEVTVPAKGHEENLPAPSAISNGNYNSGINIYLKSASEEMSTHAVLPPLLIDKRKNYAFSFGDEKVLMSVVNGFKSLSGNDGSDDVSGCPEAVHLVKFSHHSGISQKVLLSSAVTCVCACSGVLVVSCADATVHLFDSSGRRCFPPFAVPAPLSQLVTSEGRLAAVTTTGRFFLWRLVNDRPEVLLRNECVLSLLSSGRPSESDEETEPIIITKLSLTESGDPILVTSGGKSFVFDFNVGTWLKLADTRNTVADISSYAYSSSSGTRGSRVFSEKNASLPLSSLIVAANSGSSMISSAVTKDLSPALRNLANISHCESQMKAAFHLKSPREYKYWLLRLTKHLSEEGQPEWRLRNLLDSFLEPKNPTGDAKMPFEWESSILDLDKRQLLTDALKVVSSSVARQRLYLEYQDQLGSGEEMKELNGLLHDDTEFNGEVVEAS